MQTRDGREVRIYATDGYGILRIHGAVKSIEGGWISMQWTLLGRAFVTMAESPHDLIPKPLRVTGWLSLYEQSLVGVRLYPTQELAKEDSTVDCIGQIYIDAEIKT